MITVRQIVDEHLFSPGNLVLLLSARDEEAAYLRSKACETKLKFLGNKVFFRGLIELTNVCEKDCLYCGIRKSNDHVHRYNLTDDEVMEAAIFALQENWGSVVIQGGEITNHAHTERINRLIRQIKAVSNGKLGITLSLGEQPERVYRSWFEAGAHRYLLRIESSNPALYEKLHPGDGHHLFSQRLQALEALKNTGYQTGTGVMIGAPFQTLEDLAGDLLFFSRFDTDMVGMGPYIEHDDTPLNSQAKNLPPLKDRFELAINMVAILRLMMPDINIAATTALQAIDPMGREKAIRAGANILMPNITPARYKVDYKLYNNKPCTGESPEECSGCLDARISMADGEIGYGEWGDSRHFKKRTES